MVLRRGASRHHSIYQAEIPIRAVSAWEGLKEGSAVVHARCSLEDRWVELIVRLVVRSRLYASHVKHKSTSFARIHSPCDPFGVSPTGGDVSLVGHEPRHRRSKENKGDRSGISFRRALRAGSDIVLGTRAALASALHATVEAVSSAISAPDDKGQISVCSSSKMRCRMS
ncbi:hypothetical protein OBBRIDRAFT_798219 [Obba rivulosa]|uniref:Uncharacterized protein n=1 Tax=Obba rivulosa TaxID=1052685 RepID=A0A8E2DEZ1_9APHY|nr:hypothetical protein OBBRIDRAFT_798219 [Obba rivulosa]